MAIECLLRRRRPARIDLALDARRVFNKLQKARLRKEGASFLQHTPFLYQYL